MTRNILEVRPIIHLISGLGAGGAENFLLRLLSANPSLRKASRIVSIRSNDDLSESFRAIGVPVQIIPLGPNIASVASLRRIAFELGRPEVELIQSWLYFADAVATLLGRILHDKPVVWGIRSSHGASGKGVTRLFAQHINPWLSRRFPAAIICCGKAARSAHESLGYDSDRMTVIQNGFDVCSFRYDLAARVALREGLGVQPNEFLIGMVARVDIYKDHETLFSAIAQVRSRIPQLKLLLCGNGVTLDNPVLHDALARYDLLEIVMPLGLRRDLLAIYSALDLHVLSSKSEGFPNVVAEAVLCGCASISSDVGDASEILSDARWLVPPSSPDALAAKLLQYYAMSEVQQDTLRESNAAWVAEHFEIDQIARRYIELYQAISPKALPEST